MHYFVNSLSCFTMDDATQDPTQRGFLDTSEDCAICLEPLDGLADSDSPVVLTLSCGHRWHRECLVQQLQQAQPSSTSRLLFNGCQCGKCGAICDHPALEDLTRTTDVLRGKVDRLVEEQLAIDAPALMKEAVHQKGSQKKSLLEEARRKYSFFLCKHCQEPYFGGTVECADAFLLDNEASATVEEERLCPTCSPQSQIVCQNALEHQHCLIWKCRYCCQPATHVCYGNVHFCNSCHERNGQAVKDQQQQHRNTRQGATRRPQLKPTPCPGSSCSFPKPQHQAHHNNGATKESEQVYFCSWCESSARNASAGTTHSLNIPLGSHNLLQNPSGAQGLAHWKPHRAGRSARTWKVETSDWPVNASTTTNFVSSFYPCVMTQQVDLQRIVKSHNNPHPQGSHLPSQTVQLEFSARCKARTDCPSFFQMQAVLLDNTQQAAVERQSTPRLEAPADCWERVALTLNVNRAHVARGGGPRYAVLVVIGQDGRFWQGDYGSKVAECSIRVLANSREELRQVAHSSVAWCQDVDVAVNPSIHDEDGTSQMRRSETEARRHDRSNLPRNENVHQEQTSEQMDTPRVSLWWEGVFPLVFLLILAFLLAS